MIMLHFEKNIDQKGVPAKVQKVSFIRGKQLFGDEDCDSAIKCFKNLFLIQFLKSLNNKLHYVFLKHFF